MIGEPVTHAPDDSHCIRFDAAPTASALLFRLTGLMESDCETPANN
jgi:hypothetical protein